MVDRMKQQRGGPPQGGGGYDGGGQSGDPMQAIYDRIMAIISGGTLDEQTIAELGQLWSIQQAYQQQQQYGVEQDTIDYKMDYNNFLRDELGYKGDQLAFAREQFEFQSGPEFEFYKQERGMQHESTMKGYESSMQQSADDVLRSANYLQQQRYGTEAAGYNRDIARYQAQQAMGMAPNPRNEYVGSLAKLVGY
jgi:hypothetical protein